MLYKSYNICGFYAMVIVGFYQHNALMDDFELIGRNIARIRIEKRFSQEQLCEISGVDRSHFSSIENGRRNLSVKTLIRIARALEVSPMELLRDLPKDGE